MLYRSKLILNHCSLLLKQFYSNNLANLSPSKRVQELRKMALTKSRENPVIITLDTAEFKSLFNEELNKLVSLFKEYGYEIRVAGGAVRDLLMGKKPTDLDFATTATPAQMKDMFTAEEIRMINMNGEKHGTITPRINDKVNFEVTTLRIDVVTDGRHAEVQFTTDWLLDALRRDLTINSMFLGLDGSVYDYFFGYDDLKNHRVAFVGDAITRIQEDYLRILRYFRFYGKIALTPYDHEKDTLKSIKDNASGLGRISGERIWTELKKILEGNFAGEIMVTILENDIAQYIGLPQDPNISELKKVWQQSGHHNLHAITLLSTLLYNMDDAIILNARLKLSAFERDLALFVVEHRQVKLNEKPLMPYQQLVLKCKSKPLDMKKMVIEVLKYNNSPYLEELEKWDIPQFPVSGKMLKEAGVQSGRLMGLVLTELRNFWADHDFNLSAEDVLKELPHVLHLLTERKNNK